jgi:hypothetical protein
MKTHGFVEVKNHSFFTSAQVGDELRFPAALVPGKELPGPTGYEAGNHPGRPLQAY